VCDVRQDAARAYARDLPASVRVFGDHREMAASGGIDVAVVALPHYLHFPVASDLLDAGIPVLVEKPLTCTIDETRQLRELAAARGVRLTVGQMRRFNPDAVWLSQWVRGDPDSFGELHSFDLQSWQNVLGYTRGSDHWILDGKRAGGGVVISLAVHQLDLIRFITGCDFSEVIARGRFDPPFYNGAESSATVQLVMDNGASGVLHASYTAPRVPYSEAMSLFGSRGAIIQRAERIGQYHGPFKYASVTGRETREWGQMYEDFASVPRSEVSELDDNPFVNQLVHLARALHDGATPVNHVDENFNTMACLHAINDSLRSGRAESVAAR
jgi:predicted dehydrogenase